VPHKENAHPDAVRPLSAQWPWCTFPGTRSNKRADRDLTASAVFPPSVLPQPGGGRK